MGTYLFGWSLLIGLLLVVGFGVIGAAQRRHPARWALEVSRWIPPLMWLGGAAAWVAIVSIDVETVLVTGPMLLVLGLVAIGTSFRRQHRWGITAGLANIGIVVLFVGLVNLLSWSPNEAEGPFAALGAVFLLTTAPVAALAWWSRPRARQPWECANCGYTLFGLDSARCPECGTVFDPAEVARHTPSEAVNQLSAPLNEPAKPEGKQS